jgi:hypothetical protein
MPVLNFVSVQENAGIVIQITLKTFFKNSEQLIIYWDATQLHLQTASFVSHGYVRIATDGAEGVPVFSLPTPRSVLPVWEVFNWKQLLILAFSLLYNFR